MWANLHLHSRYSDGTVWPDQIAERAAEEPLELVALTDHDTLSGTREFAEACRKRGVKTVAGVEIDCREPEIGYKSELLAYFPAGSYARTDAFLDGIRRSRLEAMRQAIDVASERFGDKRLRFSELSARKRAGRADSDPSSFSYSKVDVYRFLRDERVIPADIDYRSFKRVYFDSRLLSNGPREKPLCSEVAEIVTKDGGVLVVPHIGHEFGDDPARMKSEKNRLLGLLQYFRSIGVRGVELYRYRNEKSDLVNRLVKKTAAPLGFLFTYGSDCHGPLSGKDTIGGFAGDFKGFPNVDDRSRAG